MEGEHLGGGEGLEGEGGVLGDGDAQEGQGPECRLQPVHTDVVGFSFLEQRVDGGWVGELGHGLDGVGFRQDAAARNGVTEALHGSLSKFVFFAGLSRSTASSKRRKTVSTATAC